MKKELLSEAKACWLWLLAWIILLSSAEMRWWAWRTTIKDKERQLSNGFAGLWWPNKQRIEQLARKPLRVSAFPTTSCLACWISIWIWITSLNFLARALVIGLLGRWNGSLAGSCVPCLRSSSVGSRSPSVGLRCSALGLLESFLGLLGCSATCWFLLS